MTAGSMKGHKRRRGGGTARLRSGRGAVRIMFIGDWPGIVRLAPATAPATMRTCVRLILNLASEYTANVRQLSRFNDDERRA